MAAFLREAGPAQIVLTVSLKIWRVIEDKIAGKATPSSKQT
ncbi:hypothetical protein [Selenomonas ruminantium]|nr:hypothetical protein [Selenomonas ruminantium]